VSEPAKKEKDSLSRFLAIAGFVISVITFYLSTVDKRYGLIVSTDTTAFELNTSTPSFTLGRQAFSFLNTGTQPVSIESVSYTPMVLGDEPDDHCSDKYQRDRAKSDPLALASNTYLGALAKDFVPFAVRPSELEPRTYAFQVPFRKDAFNPPDPQAKAKFFVACLEIDFFSQATGRSNFRATAAKYEIKGPLPGFISINAQSFEVLNQRWPFYFINNLFASFGSPSIPSQKR